MIRKTNRETLLEKRITRLENMIKNGRCTRKFEEVMIDDVADLAVEWFDDNYSKNEYDPEDHWIKAAGGYRNFLRNLRSKNADPIVDDCCYFIGCEDDDDDRDRVEDALAQCARNELKA